MRECKLQWLAMQQQQQQQQHKSVRGHSE